MKKRYKSTETHQERRRKFLRESSRSHERIFVSRQNQDEPPQRTIEERAQAFGSWYHLEMPSRWGERTFSEKCLANSHIFRKARGK